MRQVVAKRLKRSVLCRKGPLRDNKKWEAAYRGAFYFIEHNVKTRNQAGKVVTTIARQKAYDPVKSPRGAYRELKKQYKQRGKGE